LISRTLTLAARYGKYINYFNDGILYCDHIEEGGRLYEIVCKKDLEEIAAKPKNSPYRFTDTHTYWLKLKIPITHKRWGEMIWLLH
jgi:ATP-dependent DNA ligase